MNTILKIKYCGGGMSIHLDKFFPTSAQRLTKLLKVIRMDNNEMNLLSDLNDYFLEAKEQYESEKKTYGKEFWRLKQAASDLETEIKEKKHANGVPYTKEELKADRPRLKALKEQVKDTEREAKRAIRNVEQIQKNIEQLKDYVRNLG